MFKSPKFEDVPLAQWLAFTPHELVRAHLNIDGSVLAKIPPRKMPVVGACLATAADFTMACTHKTRCALCPRLFPVWPKN